MQDNRGKIGIAHNKDVDETNRLHAGEHIFATFLDVTLMRLESILLVKSRAHKNSSCAVDRLVESRLGNRRVTCNRCQSVSNRSEEQQL